VKNQQLFLPFSKRPGYGLMKYFYYTFCQGYMNYPPAAYVVTFALLYSYEVTGLERGGEKKKLVCRKRKGRRKEREREEKTLLVVVLA
jgi:hypothetical protein